MTKVQVSNSFVDQYPTIPLDMDGDTTSGYIQKVSISGIAPSITAGQLSNYTSIVLEASKIIKNSAGKLFVISGYSTANQYIQVFNSTTLPANGVIPSIVIQAVANSTFGYTAPAIYGRYFSTGIVICNSSTGDTKTLGGSTCLFDVQYL